MQAGNPSFTSANFDESASAGTRPFDIGYRLPNPWSLWLNLAKGCALLGLFMVCLSCGFAIADRQPLKLTDFQAVLDVWPMWLVVLSSSLVPLWNFYRFRTAIAARLGESLTVDSVGYRWNSATQEIRGHWSEITSIQRVSQRPWGLNYHLWEITTQTGDFRVFEPGLDPRFGLLVFRAHLDSQVKLAKNHATQRKKRGMLYASFMPLLILFADHFTLYTYGMALFMYLNIWAQPFEYAFPAPTRVRNGLP